MSQQIQTVLTGDAGLGADETGDWHFITTDELLLSCYDADSFASGVLVEYDLTDEPLAEGQTDPNALPLPTQLAPMHDSLGDVAQVDEARSDIPLSFIANKYRIRARTVGGDGNTLITSRINA